MAEAIHDSGVPRSEIFLTTKLWPKDYGDHKKSRAAAFGSMARLDTDYIDLYMMHWPVCPSSITDPKKCLAETWRELEILLDEGRFRAIGVSNFMVRLKIKLNGISNMNCVFRVKTLKAFLTVQRSAESFPMSISANIILIRMPRC